MHLNAILSIRWGAPHQMRIMTIGWSHTLCNTVACLRMWFVRLWLYEICHVTLSLPPCCCCCVSQYRCLDYFPFARVIVLPPSPVLLPPLFYIGCISFFIIVGLPCMHQYRRPLTIIRTWLSRSHYQHARLAVCLFETSFLLIKPNVFLLFGSLCVCMQNALFGCLYLGFLQAASVRFCDFTVDWCVS